MMITGETRPPDGVGEPYYEDTGMPRVNVVNHLPHLLLVLPHCTLSRQPSRRHPLGAFSRNWPREQQQQQQMAMEPKHPLPAAHSPIAVLLWPALVSGRGLVSGGSEQLLTSEQLTRGDCYTICCVSGRRPCLATVNNGGHRIPLPPPIHTHHMQNALLTNKADRRGPPPPPPPPNTHTLRSSLPFQILTILRKADAIDPLPPS